jgi:cytochrome c peroxidase
MQWIGVALLAVAITGVSLAAPGRSIAELLRESWTKAVAAVQPARMAPAAIVPRARGAQAAAVRPVDRLDADLVAVLAQLGFTGRVASTLEARLGRPVDPVLAELGRKLFFDSFTSLHDDNACAGCHSPAAGFGDTQSIAIGIDNNGVVGPRRKGARNQRRSPMVVNTAFYPKLMWNGRFQAPSNDPFSNAQGFLFPAPEGSVAFPPNDPKVRQLLVAQAHIPPTELVEVAGFTGVSDLGTRFLQFDDGEGSVVPAADGSGFRNEPIRQAVLDRLNSNAAYRALFAASFPEVAAGARIDFSMFGRAIAEFEFTLVRANAPLDRFARGEHTAMEQDEKKGALLFFGKAGCVACHAVSGSSNEMFSDFQMHNIAVPQIAPEFGVDKGNMIFDGPGEDEDFGLAQLSGATADRYKFRTTPLRNVALQPAFFHNGAYINLRDAIRHHLDPEASVATYSGQVVGVAADLWNRLGPGAPPLAALDPLLLDQPGLTDNEVHQLVAFVGEGLLDADARAELLCLKVPAQLPSGRAKPRFQGCERVPPQ